MNHPMYLLEEPIDNVWAADIETTGLLQDLIDQGPEAKLHNFGLRLS